MISLPVFPYQGYFLTNLTLVYWFIYQITYIHVFYGCCSWFVNFLLPKGQSRC